MKKPPKEFNEYTKSRSAERAADSAVLKTLSYRAVFKYPLTYYQLGTFLITNKKIDLHRFFHAVKRLTKGGKVKVQKDVYFFSNSNILDWHERFQNSKANLDSNMHVLKIIGTIPWIKLLAVTGSVAAFNAESDDDLDIFIVTAKNRLWLTRFFVFMFLKTLGKYPSGGSQKLKVCPNLYVDEKSIKWPENKRNIYIAHEILMMQPIVNRDNMYFKFMKENKWTHEYFANYENDYELTKLQKVEGSKLLDLIENQLMTIQLAYMKGKKTREVVSKNIIHFNKNDWSEKILTDYKKLSGKN